MELFEPPFSPMLHFVTFFPTLLPPVSLKSDKLYHKTEEIIFVYVAA